MMSIFGSIMRDFDTDPLFSSQLETMRRMEAMMDNMMAPFGGMMGLGMPRLTAGMAPRSNNTLMPYGFGRSLFPSISDVYANMSEMAQNPYCHSYSSSSVMTYTTDEMGRPQVYQATSSMRTAPGGVKETRKTVQDTRSGLQQMAIGHHLGERAHIIEQARNRYTGESNENQEFINVDEEEADEFNQEWQEKATQGYGVRPNQMPSIMDTQPLVQQPPSRVQELPAIMPGPSVPQPEPEQVNKTSNGYSRKRDNADLAPGSTGHHRSSDGKHHKRRHHGKSKHHDKSKQSRPKQETSM